MALAFRIVEHLLASLVSWLANGIQCAFDGAGRVDDHEVKVAQQALHFDPQQAHARSGTPG